MELLPTQKLQLTKIASAKGLGESDFDFQTETTKLLGYDYFTIYYKPNKKYCLQFHHNIFTDAPMVKVIPGKDQFEDSLSFTYETKYDFNFIKDQFNNWTNNLRREIPIETHLNEHDVSLNWLPNNINHLFDIIKAAGLKEEDFIQDEEPWGGTNYEMREDQRRALRICWRDNPKYRFVWHEANRRTQTYFEPKENGAYKYKGDYSLHNDSGVLIIGEVNRQFRNWLEELKKRIEEEKKFVRRIQETTQPELSVSVNLEGWDRIDRTVKEIKTSLKQASTEEQFQTVGLLCRETIISLAQAIYNPEKHPILDGVKISNTDAKRMLDAYITVELAGGANENLRRYARVSSDLANELAHKRTAILKDASICVEATITLVKLIGTIEDRH